MAGVAMSIAGMSNGSASSANAVMVNPDGKDSLATQRTATPIAEVSYMSDPQKKDGPQAARNVVLPGQTRLCEPSTLRTMSPFE
ncbi:hypothetical protein D3C71_1923120 [compost metagenome]